MQLIALKYISSQLPKGAIFDANRMQARFLIAVKAAKPYEDAPAPEPVAVPRAPEPPATEPPAPEPVPEEPPTLEPAAASRPRRGRSFPIGHRNT